MFTFLKWIVAPVVFAILVLLLERYFFPGKASLPAISSATNQTTIRTQILEKLRSVNELNTSIATIQTIVANRQGKKLLGIEFASTKLLYVAIGQVRAGIDLTKLSHESISFDPEHHLHLALPPPEILDSKIDVELSYVYDVQRSLILSPDTFELQSDAQRSALEEIKKAATQCGVLKSASDQAKTVLTALLSMMGFEEVSVEVAAIERIAPSK